MNSKSKLIFEKNRQRKNLDLDSERQIKNYCGNLFFQQWHFKVNGWMVSAEFKNRYVQVPRLQIGNF